MSAPEALAIFAAGGAAGTINAIVGSGTLITFPVLLAFGYSPVTANVSNSIGLVPGSVAGAYGYRRELEGQVGRALGFGVVSAAGGVAGALLLLAHPSAFDEVVPGFIAAAIVLVVVQPWIRRRLAGLRGHPLAAHGAAVGGLLAVGVYGGYFGAGQGILIFALLALSLHETLQRVNALRNVLAGTTNLVAGVVFAIAAPHVSWAAAALLAGSSLVGGHAGARVARRLPPAALRAIVVVVGILAILKLEL